MASLKMGSFLPGAKYVCAQQINKLVTVIWGVCSPQSLNVVTFEIIYLHDLYTLPSASHADSCCVESQHFPQTGLHPLCLDPFSEMFVCRRYLAV